MIPKLPAKLEKPVEDFADLAAKFKIRDVRALHDEIDNALFIANSAIEYEKQGDYDKPLNDMDNAIKRIDQLLTLFANERFIDKAALGVDIKASILHEMPEVEEYMQQLEQHEEIKKHIAQLEAFRAIMIRSRQCIKEMRGGGRKLETRIKYVPLNAFILHLACYWRDMLGRECNFSFDYDGFGRFADMVIEMVVLDRQQLPTSNELRTPIEKAKA